MASNRIIDKVVLATIQKASQRFVLEAATETETFQRTEKHVNVVKVRIIGIVQGSDKILPANTAKAVVRWVLSQDAEYRHSSELRRSEFEHGADNHIDVVCLDKDGKYIKTEHIVPKKWDSTGWLLQTGMSRRYVEAVLIFFGFVSWVRWRASLDSRARWEAFRYLGKTQSEKRWTSA